MYYVLVCSPTHTFLHKWHAAIVRRHMETTQIPAGYEMMPASRNFAWLPPQQSIICSKGGKMLLMAFVNSAGGGLCSNTHHKREVLIQDPMKGVVTRQGVVDLMDFLLA